MLRIEMVMKILLALCSLLVISSLLILIGYLSFRGLLVRKDIQSSVLPDYKQDFTWPEAMLTEGQAMNLWLSSAINLGKLRADKLHDILVGKEKNWVDLAESSERLTMLLTKEQLQSLGQANAANNWRKSRNIKEEPSYASAAQALLQTPGAMAILPSSWGPEKWRELQKAKGGELPRKLSLASSSLLLRPQDLKMLSQSNREPYAVPLKAVKPLLQGQARITAYNWLTGTVESLAGYQPVQLLYREYQILKISFLLAPPAKNGKVGGISTMLISSLILIFISLLWAGPLGLSVAVFLVEYAQTGATTVRQKAWQKRFTSIVNAAIQTLSGIPSIIFGLFGSILFVPLFGIGLLSGSATLVLMLLPTIILTAKEALQTVPRSYIEGSLGLGAQRWYTIWHISLPSALPGILAGVILAMGRALGETAALIYTLGTGYQAALSRFPQLLGDWPVLWQQFWLSPSLAKIAQIAQAYPLLDLHSSLRSISLHLYWMTINGISLQKGFSTAFILIFLIVLLNMGARALLTRFSSKHQV